MHTQEIEVIEMKQYFLQGMIAIQSTNLTSINTMNLTYNCVLTYI